MDPGAPEAWEFSPGLEYFGEEKERVTATASESKDSGF